MKKDTVFSCIRLLLLLVCQLTAADMQGQAIDSVSVNTKKRAFDLQLDKRNTFLKNKDQVLQVDVNGLNAGFTFNSRYRIGLGAYLISDAIAKPYVTRNVQYKKVLVQKAIQLYYVTPNFSYIFYRSQWLDLAIPLEIGIGRSNISQADTNGTSVPLYSFRYDKTLRRNVASEIPGKNIFFIGELGLLATIKLSDDVGLSSSIGYRQILKEIGLEQDFNGLYYSVGLKLFPTPIKERVVRDYKAWRAKKALEKSPAQL